MNAARSRHRRERPSTPSGWLIMLARGTAFTVAGIAAIVALSVLAILVSVGLLWALTGLLSGLL